MDGTRPITRRPCDVGAGCDHRVVDEAQEPARAASGWEFTARLWRWKEGSWHFITVPEAVSDEIDALVGEATGGFGSVRVEVTVGGSTWQTSLFPSSEEAAFVCPVKRPVRTAEGVEEGDDLRVRLRVVAR